MTRPILALLCSLAIGCGGSASSSGTTTTTSGASTAIAGPPRSWAEMSHGERAEYMGSTILPRMTGLFGEYDAQRFADFDCTTCHGETAHARNFAMPNPDIIALYPTGSVGQQDTVRRFPNGVVFMYSRVLPTMQAMLGAQEFDTETGEGFSCYACHTHGTDPALAAPAP